MVELTLTGSFSVEILKYIYHKPVRDNKKQLTGTNPSFNNLTNSNSLWGCHL